MTATASPVHMLPSSPMRFGVWRALPVSRMPRQSPPDGVWQAEWCMRRSLPVSAPKLMVACLLLVVFAGLMLGVMGLPSPSTMPLALLAMLAMSFGVARAARIAADGEHIGLRADLIRVTRRQGGRLQVTDFAPRWVRVEPELHDRSLICLSGQGRHVTIGGHLPAQERRQLADEIRWALRQFDD